MKKSGVWIKWCMLALFMLISWSLSFDICRPEDNVQATAPAWTEDFGLEKCDFVSVGKNDYFILEPNYRLTLEGTEDTVTLWVTVLEETEKIGAIDARVVEERESTNGRLAEVSRNYYALCSTTGSIFYFGEDVDVYENGKVISHHGGWRADSSGARAGLMMPGLALLGAKYYQEIAPGVAMDRAEIISLTDSLKTPAGNFDHCLKTEETTPLEPRAREYKVYASGIGLIKDGDLLLIKHGYIK